jgi:large exoprotein involved in heme utilization and adhesion
MHSLAGSEFVVTGTGGLPPSPNQALSEDIVEGNLIEPTSTANLGRQLSSNQFNSVRANQPSMPNSQEIVPAQGWVINDKDEVILTAHNFAGHTIQRTRDKAVYCPTSSVFSR